MKTLAAFVIGLAAWSISFTSYAQSGAITIASTAVTVGNTSTSVAVANSHRRFLLLINDSDTNIYCKFGAAATTHAGVLLVANGGGLILDSTGVSQQAINCITVTGSKTLLVSQGQ